MRVVAQVPLGKTSGFLIEEYDFLEELAKRFNITGAGHEEMKPHHLDRIGRHPHLFTVQITDQRHFFYATRLEGQPVCVVLGSRSRKQHLVTADLDAKLYDGTVLTGEYHRSRFFVNDLLAYCGKLKVDLSLPQRLHLAVSMLRSERREDPAADTFGFVMKPYYSLAELHKVQQINNELRPFNIPKFRSLLFTPVTFAEFRGSLAYHMRLQELRPNNLKETIDANRIYSMRLSRDAVNPDVYELSVRIGDRDVDMGLAYVPDIETSRMLRRATAPRPPELRVPSVAVFECCFNRTFKKWQPMREVS